MVDEKTGQIIDKWAYKIAHGLNQRIIHTLANPNKPCHENVFEVVNSFFKDLDELQRDALDLALKEMGE
jgi:hypothetical protein